MTVTAHDLVDETLRSVERLKATLTKHKSQRLVRSQDERQLVKATCLAWFNSARKQLQTWQFDGDFGTIDAGFGRLLDRTAQDTSRSKYFDDLNALKTSLIDLRARSLLAKLKPVGGGAPAPPPSFSPLVPDLAMRAILERRWRETGLCMQVGADLAATVMIGGLLEGLLLARLNLMPNAAPAFKAAAAPPDKQGKTLPLKDWTLKNYIDVAHELGWITSSGKDVGAVVRDYRKYVHPAKELSHGVTISPGDIQMLWSVFVSLSGQLLTSATHP